MKKSELILKVVFSVTLLCVISFLIALVINNFQTYNATKALISDDDNLITNMYIANNKIQLVMAITNLIMLIIIFIFSILYILNILSKKNIVKTSLILIISICIEIYLIQQFIVNLISYTSLSQNTLFISITSLICFVAIGILILSYILHINKEKREKK